MYQWAEAFTEEGAEGLMAEKGPGINQNAIAISLELERIEYEPEQSSSTLGAVLAKPWTMVVWRGSLEMQF